MSYALPDCVFFSRGVCCGLFFLVGELVCRSLFLFTCRFFAGGFDVAFFRFMSFGESVCCILGCFLSVRFLLFFFCFADLPVSFFYCGSASAFIVGGSVSWEFVFVRLPVVFFGCGFCFSLFLFWESVVSFVSLFLFALLCWGF